MSDSSRKALGHADTANVAQDPHTAIELLKRSRSSTGHGNESVMSILLSLHADAAVALSFYQFIVLQGQDNALLFWMDAEAFRHSSEDGPGKRFEQLNDIIEKYLVKASEHFVPSAHAHFNDDDISTVRRTGATDEFMLIPAQFFVAKEIINLHINFIQAHSGDSKKKKRQKKMKPRTIAIQRTVEFFLSEASRKGWAKGAQRLQSRYVRIEESEFMRSPRSPSPDTRSCSKSPKRKSDGLKRSSTTPDLARLSENQEPVTITHENSDSIVGKTLQPGYVQGPSEKKRTSFADYLSLKTPKRRFSSSLIRRAGTYSDMVDEVDAESRDLGQCFKTLIFSPPFTVLRVMCDLEMKDGQYGTRNCLFSTIVKATSNELKFSLLQMLFEADISAHGNSEATILRCDSPATLLMSKYLAIEGKDYIASVVGPVEEAVRKMNIEYPGDNMTSDIKNDILNLGELLLSKLEASISRFPAPIRQVCSFVYDQIEERFPGMGTQGVSSLVILRGVCPAMVVAEDQGANPSAGQRKLLILVSKMIQALASGIEFDDSKERIMVELNSFLGSGNRRRMSSFMQGVCEPQQFSRDVCEDSTYHEDCGKAAVGVEEAQREKLEGSRRDPSTRTAPLVVLREKFSRRLNDILPAMAACDPSSVTLLAPFIKSSLAHSHFERQGESAALPSYFKPAGGRARRRSRDAVQVPRPIVEFVDDDGCSSATVVNDADRASDSARRARSRTIGGPNDLHPFVKQ